MKTHIPFIPMNEEKIENEKYILSLGVVFFSNMLKTIEIKL